MKKQIVSNRKLELISVREPQSVAEAVEDLMVFDARCLDKATWLELVRVLPELTNIRRAWKAHFAAHGCVSCRRKKKEYCAGGFCLECYRRIAQRMRTCFRKLNAHRNIPNDIAALSRKFEAAQRLFNGPDCPAEPLPVKRVAAKSGVL